MKRFTVIILSVLLVLGFSACGNQKADNGGQTTDSASQAAADSTNDTTEALSGSDGSGAENTSEPSSSNGGKTLVVYYSASGNTERIAKAAAEAAEADLFEIVPAHVYSDDDLNWSDENSRVSREHADESLRNVPLSAAEVENWEFYDTVLIGYPIWWGIAAWPVDGFVKANDFTGKTVIPFCTSASSGLGDSGKLLSEMANSGIWQEGQRFSSGASEQTVKDWVDSLDLNK